MLASRFLDNTYLVRRKVLKLFGGAFHVYDASGDVVLFANMKAFKLKEDIRLYASEDMQIELLFIKARRVIDISSEYDVTDSQTGQRVGVLKRKGLKSMVRDEWIFMDPLDQPIGSIREDSTAMALIRRFIPFANLIPQQYNGENPRGSGVHLQTECESLCHEDSGRLLRGCESVARSEARTDGRNTALRH